MKKLFLLFALVLIYACSDDTPTSPNPEPAKKLPKIFSVNPDSARADETIFITGENFPSKRDSVSVIFEKNILAEIDSLSPAKISVRVPAGAEDGYIKVAVGKDTAVTKEKFHRIKPEFTGFTPAESKINTELTIKGKNFGSDKSAVSVRFGDDPAEILSVADSEIRVYVPYGAEQERKIFLQVKKDTLESAATHRSIARTDFRSCRIQLSHIVISIRYSDTASTVKASQGKETFIVDTVKDFSFDLEFFADANVSSDGYRTELHGEQNDATMKKTDISFVLDGPETTLYGLRCTRAENSTTTQSEYLLDFGSIPATKTGQKIQFTTTGNAIKSLLKNFHYLEDYFVNNLDKPHRVIKSLAVKNPDNAILTITIE